eukprot:TRINITY_DN5680_c0_g1_i3.p1 TRINITY_DN5680_c0_g1~~TRINITY_DN5680_c0_g1_i3.p1  ORF type:complete len:335 (-),score=62.82 TRINITY_DN5680_c0_g1_i3:208-1212(-)
MLGRPNLSHLMDEFARDVRGMVADGGGIHAGALAVCGPVWEDGRMNDPNNLWPGEFERAEVLEGVLGIQDGLLRFLNDFEAIGHGIAALQDSAAPPECRVCKEDTLLLHEGEAEGSDYSIACLGAGTGLGACYLTRSGERYVVSSSEAGMCDSFSPCCEREWRLKQWLMRMHGSAYVEVERVVSGPGIVDTYRFLQQEMRDGRAHDLVKGVEWDPSLVDRNLDAEEPDERARVITTSVNQDPLCREAVRLFLKTYGRELGATAQRWLCFGGLYIAGGVLPKIIDMSGSEELVTAYLNQGTKMSEIVSRVPLRLITDTSVGLKGALYLGLDLLPE